MGQYQREQKQRARAFKKSRLSTPGTILFSGGTAIACSLTIGVSERDTRDGGFVRTRTATVLVAKADLPTLPDLEERTAVTLTPEGLASEVFRIFESHDQSAEHWLIRCGQW